MRPILTAAVLGTALLLGACSGAEPDAPPQVPLELPEPPPGAEQLDDAAAEDHLTTMLQAINQNGGTTVTWEAVFDVTDGGLEVLVSHYDEALTSQGWVESDRETDIGDSLGVSWRKDDQSVVLMNMLDLHGRDVAILVGPSEEES